MNPRLLRPTSSTLDADAAVYLNAVAQADGEQLEPAVRRAINDFVVGCKLDGIWDAIKASCILAGARTLSGALVPLKGTAPTNNGPFVSDNYDRETGLLGDGTSKELDTGRANNADPQNSKHVALYVSSVATVTADTYIGSPTFNVAGSTSLFRGSVSSNWGVNRPATASLLAVANADMTGFVGMNRFQAADFQYRAAGATAASGSFASGTPESGNLFVFSTGGDYYSNARMAFYSIGESLDLSLLDARVTALITAIGAAI
jgi:hypothetical protein